jgi:uncharacterized protein (DUF1501 family)
MMTRRFFVRGSAVIMAGAGTAPSWLARAASVAEARRKVLVAIFQRGAADGLNIVAPFGEKRYYTLRPTIAVQPPGGPNGTVDLDGHFGLNPALQALKPLWEKQQLAIIEATGSPDPSRSHFDAQDYMESGTPGLKTTGDGWLNRALPAAGPHTSALQAVALGAQLPHALRGDRPAIAVNDVQQFQVRDTNTAGILESLYETTDDPQLGRAGKDAFAAMKMIQTINRQPYTPSGGAQYGVAGQLGRSLQQIARLIKADAGVEAAFAEINGWDHHGNEVAQMGGVLRELGTALAAFCTDMGDRMEDIVLVTMSEFGRTAQENGNAGTDHGHGDLMMVLGGPVRGGKIYGRWPGLEPEQLNEGRDLAVTTDFRDVLGELVSAHLGQKNLAQVFPGFTPSAPLGFLRT